MTEKAHGKSEAEKKKRRRKKGVDNVAPAEEPVKGPKGEDIFRV